MANNLEQQIKSLDLKQNAIKILINSFYGAFGNRYFYFHNNDIAQSITLQGQDLIKFSIKAVNHYFQNRWHEDTELHEILGISGRTINKIEKEAAVYTDTDSVYVCFDYAIQSVEGLTLDNKESLEFCLAINRNRLKNYFEQAFEKYALHFNTNNRQNFELENLSRSGIWLAKKKYVLKVSYKDNKHEALLEKESLIIKGLEAIQSSYPLYAVNSETLDYSEIPEACQEYVGKIDVKVPPEVFPIYISAISKYGLNTVVVPKHELTKYRERIAKKLGIQVSDPFAVPDSQMREFLAANDWTEIIEGSWIPTKKLELAIKKGQDYYQFSAFTADAYKMAIKKTKASKKVKEEA